MCGSGWQTGMVNRIIRIHLPKIHQALEGEILELCGVARGLATIMAISDLPTVVGSCRRIRNLM